MSLNPSECAANSLIVLKREDILPIVLRDALLEMELCNPEDYYNGHYKQYISLWVELSAFYEENNLNNILILKDKMEAFFNEVLSNATQQLAQ